MLIFRSTLPETVEEWAVSATPDRQYTPEAPRSPSPVSSGVYLFLHANLGSRDTNSTVVTVIEEDEVGVLADTSGQPKGRRKGKGK